MKPAQKPFVVEFKNRRRVPRKDASIWGRIDLKATGGEIADEHLTTETIDPHLHEAAAIQDETEITA
ncbi:hypothetical protein HW571_28755 [Agrobacterium genomosp. 3]|uniref:hypothetical protein n=1 Tax=Agrobacterium tomkonis TaxID=1183410 RepID=UPI001CD86F87|nr:hypothetical protein [Agrobacterium tomkonis]MCA1879935.1 hypothetical protein [Agrobacterium tumefaciens]MCA1895172.1 hypothetical protein [Agrobacterium tomkonis]